MKQNKIKKILLIGFWILLLVGVLAFQVDLIFLQEYKTTRSPFKKGESVPNFTLPTIDGRKIQLSQYIQAKPTLLVFFSPYSSPCEDEVMELTQYFSSQKQVDFQVILISEESREALLKFKKEFNPPFPILWDKEGKVFEKYQISLVPANFLISPELKLIYSYIGAEGFSVYRIQAQVKFSGKIELEKKD